MMQRAVVNLDELVPIRDSEAAVPFATRRELTPDELEVVGGVRRRIRALRVHPYERWLRLDLLPTINFTGLIDPFSYFVDQTEALYSAPLEQIPLRDLRRADGAIDAVIDALQPIRDMGPDEIARAGSRLQEVREQLATRAQSALDRASDEIAPVVSLAEAFRAQSAVQITATLPDEMRLLLKDAQDEIGQIRAFREEARASLEELGISRYAKYFRLEARVHDAAAKRWLIATAVGGVLTLGAAIGSLLLAYLAPVKEGAPIVAQVVVAKVLVLSVLLSATIWAGRVYRGHRHNEVVNRHRQNAMSSFETFAKAAADGDAATKNALLLQATTAVFTPQQTGFGEIGGEPSVGPTQVLELARSIPGAKP